MTYGGASIGDATGRIILDASGVTRGIQDAQRAARDGFAAIGQSISGVGDSIAGFGKSLSLWTAPLAAVQATALKTYGTFEDALAEIQARTGATAAEMEKVRAKALEMGRDTSFSGTQAAQAMLQLLASGYDLNQTFTALKPTLDAAAAGGMDLGYTADVVTDVLAMWNMQADKAGMVANTLAAGAAASSAEINDLAQGLSNVGPMAAQFGLSLEDTVAILAAFSERGIKGAEAGTQLRSMLTHMSATTAEVTGTWEELNISLYDMQGNVRPLNAVLADLRDRMASMSDQERIETIKALAGAYGQLGLSVLTDSDAMGDMVGLMQGQTSASEVAAARLNTLNGRLETLRGSIETLMINAIGPFVENHLKPMIAHITDIVNQVNNWAAANPELTQTVFTVISVLVGLGPALFGVGKTITLVGKAIALLSNPIGWMIIAGGLIYKAWTSNFLGIQDAVVGFFSQFEYYLDIFSATFGLMIDALQSGDFSQAFYWLKFLVNQFVGFLQNEIRPRVVAWGREMIPRLWEWIKDATPQVLTALWGLALQIGQWIIGVAPQVAAQLLEWGKALLAWIAPYIPPLIAKLTDLSRQIIGWVIAQVPVIINKLVEWGRAFINWVAPYIPVLIAFLGDLGNRLIAWVFQQIPGIVAQISAWANAFIDWVVPAAAGLLLRLPGLIADVLKWILDVTPDIVAQLLEWAAKFVEWVGPAAVDLLVALTGLGADVIQWVLSDLIPAIAAEIPGVASALIDFARQSMSLIPAAMNDFMNTLINFIVFDLIPGIAQSTIDVGEAIVNGFKQGIVNKWDEFTNWAEDQLRTGFVGKALDVLGVFSPSKVFAGIGENVVLGLKQGLSQTAVLMAQLSIMIRLVTAIGAVMTAPMFAIGANIVQGLINGINSRAGLLTATVQMLAYKVQGLMASAFKMHSPSMLFAEYGQNMIAGLAQGLGQMAPVQAAIGGLVPSRMGTGAGGTNNVFNISVPVDAGTMQRYPNAQQYAQQVGDSLAKQLASARQALGGGVAVG